MDPKLTFCKHLHEKITKAQKIIGIIKHLSNYLPLKNLVQMYKTLVRPHLDYCDIIYHEPAVINPALLGLSLTKQMKIVERIQYLANLAVTGTWQCSSRSKLYDELGWETFSDRRICYRSIQIYMIINNETPSYLKHKLLVRRRYQTNLNPTTFENVYCRTDR